MILEEFVKGIVPSARLIIEDSTGELYRGFAACLEYSTKIDRNRDIKTHGLSIDVYKKEVKKAGVKEYIDTGEKIPIETISKFEFSDLIMEIYTKVMLKD